MAPDTEPDRALGELVGRALAEDLGAGDLTSEAVIDADARGRARLIQKQPGVVFGLAAAREAFAQLGAEGFDALIVEGQWRDSVPAEVALISGPARALLGAERVALNLLARLSGIATLTARFVEAAREHRCAVLDTRKTTPGLRELEKAAVRAGGGRSHRRGLDDAILIKENHVAFAGGVTEALARARRAQPRLAIEIECRAPAEVAAALEAGVERILLDNMSVDELRECVAARRRAAGDGRARVELEASGGITLDSVAEIAATGVDFVSIGALTHSAPALDLSLLVEPA